MCFYIRQSITVLNVAMENSSNIKFGDVQAAYDDALLLADRNWIKLIAATVLANQMEGAPVWLMLVAPSSGGKTAALLTLDELEFIPGKRVSHFISDLTENTLASGFKSGAGDAGLLNQMPYGGLMIFKDFTSLLTKRGETRDAIMGQLREVFDRKFDKKTGNNQDTAWKGKVGAIAGVTTAVHEYISEMSVMGDRFIMYAPKMPDRMELLKFIMAMSVQGDNQEKKLIKAREMMHAYLKRAIKYVASARLQMSERDREYIMQVADFATKTRSGIIQDDRTGRVKFVPEPEMPTRLIEQLLAIGTVLSVMREIDGLPPELDDNDMDLLYKIAFDSIPVKRRWALRELASFGKGVTTAGLAAQIGYETEVVKEWLAQLNALGICRRLKNTGAGDMWYLNDEYVDIMLTFQSIQRTQASLLDANADPDDLLTDQALRSYGDLADEFEE